MHRCSRAIYISGLYPARYILEYQCAIWRLDSNLYYISLRNAVFSGTALSNMNVALCNYAALFKLQLALRTNDYNRGAALSLS